jgi:predicted LPLAT superfamily acyltransferase
MVVLGGGRGDLVDEPQAHSWSRMQERGSMLGLRFIVAWLRLFGRSFTVPLINAIAAYFFLVDRSGRRASRAYLARLHSRLTAKRNPGWKPTAWRSYLQYREFALSIVDRVCMWGGSEARFSFDFHGRQHFEKLSREGRGAIVFGAHLGSFDALRVLSTLDGVTVNVLMYTKHAPMINQIFRELSPDAEVRVISADSGTASTALEIRSCVERGEWVAILGDRIEPNDRGRTCLVDFMGEPALLPESPFALPVLLGCPAILMLALRSGPWRYTVFAEPLADPPARTAPADRRELARDIAALYAARLEHYCGKAPEQWFNFFDFWRGAP